MRWIIAAVTPILCVTLGLTLGFTFSGCMSAYVQTIGGNGPQIFEKVYLTDIDTAWQSVLDTMKNSHIDVYNREGGFLQTKWVDNTSEKNFTDSLGSSNVYLKAQDRFRITVAKGYYYGKTSTKISVQKEQLIQRDVLEGWRPIETDSIEENTILYRIGHLIKLKMQMARIEDEKTKKELDDTKF